MGKTTLWSAGVGGAAEAGLRVLRARPSQSESALSFSGIEPVRPRARPRARCLPPAQRRALSCARPRRGRRACPDPHAVGVAVLAAVRELARTERSCSRSTTCSDSRRPRCAGVRGASPRDRACRRAPRAQDAARECARRGLRRSLPVDRFTEVDVGPLDAGALHRLLQADLGVALPRPLLREVRQASAGNPFYALEIVRTLQRSARIGRGGPAARARVAARPRSRSPAGPASREPRLPARGRRTRPSEGAGRGGGLRGRARRRPGTSARSRDRRARREPDRLHASAARRRRLRDRRSSPPRRDPRSPRAAARGPGGSSLARRRRRRAGRDGRGRARGCGAARALEGSAAPRGAAARSGLRADAGRSLRAASATWSTPPSSTSSRATRDEPRRSCAADRAALAGTAASEERW